MVLDETIFLLALLSIFGGFTITLFKMLDSKQDKLDDNTASAYGHLRKHILDPILVEIFGSKKGKYKPQEFFNTSEVIIKLFEYRKQLFKFNKVSGMKGSIMLMLKLSLKTTISITLVILVFIAINELIINSDYNTFGINITHMIFLDLIVLTISVLFLVVFVIHFMSINASFKEQITELKGGLP